MTAVEWLHNKWGNCKVWKWEEIEQWFEQAKEMEKQQIIDIVEKSRETGLTAEYLLLTYGSKGSDETKYYEQSRGINVNSFQSEAPKKQDYIVKVTDVTSSQTEISDEEITKLANEHILYNDSKRQWVIEGMKLYREHLKNK